MPRCTWRRSASSTPPTRTPPTTRRWTSRGAPVLLRAGGGGRVRGRRRGGGGAGGDPGHCRGDGAGAGQGRHPGRDRGRRGDRRPPHGLRVGARAAARRWPLRHRRPRLPGPVAGRPPPSRLHSIEELPIALGMLLVGAGDFRRTVLACVNYGRDCDSIATMAGALVGAMHGERAVPDDWARQVARASRIDLRAPAAELVAVAREIHARDLARRRAHEAAFAALADAR
ncbi:ADP-ribosylglycohydrolase family protein [Streptomyces zhihengii]